MKKFLLSLVLVLMVGMDVGVAWGAEGNDVIDEINKIEAPECDFDNGGHIVGNQCVYDKDLPQQGDSNFQSYMCQQEGYIGWDSNAKKCVTGDELCSSLGDGLKYDPGIKNCVPSDDVATGQNVSTVQQSTLLPYTGFNETECEALFTYDAAHLGELRAILSTGEVASIDFLNLGVQVDVNPLDVLGCGIKTGRVKMWMIPFFVKYLIQFAISIAGLVAVGAVLIGGYFYLFGGLVDDRDKGKRAIMYGLGGFVVALLAWTIVNAVIALLTR